MLEILQYDFIQNALISGVLISIAAGIIGSLVVVNKITFLTGGIAHSSYGGIGLAIYLGIPVLLGATVFAVITAIIIAIITLKNRTRIDAIIGMMWASGMAIGIIFVDLTPGYNVDLMSYLFGSVAALLWIKGSVNQRLAAVDAIGSKPWVRTNDARSFHACSLPILAEVLHTMAR